VTSETGDGVIQFLLAKNIWEFGVASMNNRNLPELMKKKETP